MIIIADSHEKYAKELKDHLPDSEVIDCNGTPQKVAEAIASFKDVSSILINAEGTFGGNKIQSLAGIEILKWLRIKQWAIEKDNDKNKQVKEKEKFTYIQCPVILYGFLSIKQILSKVPEHLIINAPGNSYIQLPYSISEIEKEITNFETHPKLKQGIKDDEYRELYKPFLRPAFNIEDFRHREANWWGIKCLWDVYKICYNVDDAKFPYPKELRAWLNSIETVQAQFLLGDDTPQIPNSLNSISEVTKRVTYRESIVEKVKKIRARKLKILHIDDQNKDGWSKILRYIVYDVKENITCNFNGDKAAYFSNNNLLLKSVGTNAFSDIDEFCDYYFTNEKIFEEENWDIIILDLRLFPISDHLYSRNFEKISGAVVLDLFRQYYKYNTTPFLVTSASNKAWTLERVTKLGSDAYWMKEGLDNTFTAEETVLNFNKLIDLLEKLTDKKYQSLKQYGKWFENFDIKNGWWNNSKRWKNGEIIFAKSEDIEKLIGESIDHIRIYLQQFHLGYAYKSGERTNTEAFAISNIINKIGNIVEVIHNISDKDYNNSISVGQLVRGVRGDKLGEKIRHERHDASHRKYYTLKWYDLNKILIMVKEYLSVSPI